MSDEIVRKVFAAYHCEVVKLLSAQKGYRNESRPAVMADGSMRNLIFYKSEPGIAQRIRRANTAANHAAGHGVPARVTADPRILLLRSNGAEKHAALYTYLPGATIPWEAYTRRHIKLLGKALSDTHAGLRTLQASVYPSVADEYTAILQHMKNYFHNPSVGSAIRRKLGLSLAAIPYGLFAATLRKTTSLSGQHVLHMDFVRGNVLFADAGDQLHISGVLDFEKAAYGHPAFDIARTLAFLFVDCKYKEADKVRKYFLESGYNKRGQSDFHDITFLDISMLDISLLDTLVDLFLLYDFYKFLRHNPYECLQQNEHYARTKQILINRNTIQPL